MKIHQSTLRLALVLACLVGCSSNDPISQALLFGGGSALGGSIGHEIGDGEIQDVAIGAGVGATAAGLFSYGQGRDRKMAYSKGLDQGHADQVKRLYWIRKDTHRLKDQNEGELRRSYYPLQIPEQTVDGVKIAPHTRYIEVVE